MISIKLFSEVRRLDISSFRAGVNVIHYDFMKDGVSHTSYPINIYELAHKCKEWALKNGCVLNSCEYEKEANCEAKHPFREDRFFGDLKDFEANTEPEAIFKACEWILKQKEV